MRKIKVSSRLQFQFRFLLLFNSMHIIYRENRETDNRKKHIRSRQKGRKQTEKQKADIRVYPTEKQKADRETVRKQIADRET